MLNILYTDTYVFCSVCSICSATLLKTTKADHEISFCTDNGKLIEHIYGFLMVVERILQKYADNQSNEISE